MRFSILTDEVAVIIALGLAMLGVAIWEFSTTE